MERSVELEKLPKAESIGGWQIISKACPLTPHLKALGMKPRCCFSGCQDFRGPVPLAACEHVPGKSLQEKQKALRDAGTGLLVDCGFKEGDG